MKTPKSSGSEYLPQAENKTIPYHRLNIGTGLPLTGAQLVYKLSVLGYELNLPEKVSYAEKQDSYIPEFLYESANDKCGWLTNAKTILDEKLTGAAADKAYAKLALDQASNVIEGMPRIYGTPDGGITIESRLGDKILTLIIEGRLGVLVRSGGNFYAPASVEINSTSINELLARYVFELKIMQAVKV